MDILLWMVDLGANTSPDMLLGFLGGLFGGGSSKPDKPKETRNDKALASISKGQFGRYKSRFAPLTDRLDRLSREDKSTTLRGRGNADVMQAMGSAQGPGANGQVASATRTGTRALGTALTGGSDQARERSIRLTKGVMDAATGAGQEAIVGLGNATRLSTQESIRKMEEDVAKGRLKMDFLGSALGGAAAIGMKSPGGGQAAQSLPSHYSTGNGMRDPRTGFRGIGM